jgi:hypothetical protein
MTTKVYFVKSKEDKEITAIFPYMLGNNSPFFMTAYAHIGQHCTAHETWVIESNTAAKTKEYAKLLNELVSIGYDDLQIMTRFPFQKSFEWRQAELRK